MTETESSTSKVLVSMTQGVRGEENLRRRGERGRHWEERNEAMAGLFLVCVHGACVESEPGTQFELPAPIPKKDGTTAPAPRHHHVPPHGALVRFAVNFGRKLSARAPTLGSLPTHQPRSGKSRPSLSIAPGTSLLSPQPAAPKRAGPFGSSGPMLTNPVPGKSEWAARLINELWDAASKAGS